MAYANSSSPMQERFWVGTEVTLGDNVVFLAGGSSEQIASSAPLGCFFVDSGRFAARREERLLVSSLSWAASSCPGPLLNHSKFDLCQPCHHFFELLFAVPCFFHLSLLTTLDVDIYMTLNYPIVYFAKRFVEVFY